jgi:hypothetical protein
MGYKKHEDSIYVVQWDNFLTKIGVTSCKRWQKFVLNGGVLVGVWAIKDGQNGYKAEELLHKEVLSPYSILNLFDLKDNHWKESLKPYLGPDLGGFTELAYLPNHLTHEDIRHKVEDVFNNSEHCYRRMLPMHAS